MFSKLSTNCLVTDRWDRQPVRFISVTNKIYSWVNLIQSSFSVRLFLYVLPPHTDFFWLALYNLIVLLYFVLFSQFKARFGNCVFVLPVRFGKLTLNTFCFSLVLARISRSSKSPGGWQLRKAISLFSSVWSVKTESGAGQSNSWKSDLLKHMIRDNMF